MAGKRARSGPPGNLNAFKHGVLALDRRLKEGRLDGRSSISKALRAKEQELVTALGGDPSPQEMALISDTAKTMLYIASLDVYLTGLKTLVRKGKVHPVLSERVRLAGHLRENLKTLGLKRVSKTLTLEEMFAEDAEEGQGATQQ